MQGWLIRNAHQGSIKQATNLFIIQLDPMRPVVFSQLPGIRAPHLRPCSLHEKRIILVICQPAETQTKNCTYYW